MRNYLLVLSILFMASVSYGQDNKGDSKQKKFYISIGPDLAVPVGKSADFASIGFGVSVLGAYKPADKVDVTLQSGYINYGAKTFHLPSGSYKYDTEQLFALGGIRYYFTKSLYASGQVGYTIYTINGDVGGAFAYSPGVGVRVGVLDTTLKYIGSSENNSPSNINLRVAISF